MTAGSKTWKPAELFNLPGTTIRLKMNVILAAVELQQGERSLAAFRKYLDSAVSVADKYPGSRFCGLSIAKLKAYYYYHRFTLTGLKPTEGEQAE